MDIPRGFILVNRTWTVKLLKNKAFTSYLRDNGLQVGPEEVLLGLTAPQLGVIIINVDMHRTEEDLYHTYLHELAHALEFADGVVADHDEQKIDRLGAYMHQYEQTKRGGYRIEREQVEPAEGVGRKAARAARSARRIKAVPIPRHRGRVDNRGR